MDPRLRGFTGSMNGIKMGTQPVSVFTNQNHVVPGHRFDHSFKDYTGFPYNPPNPNPGNLAPDSNGNHEEGSPEDCDFSDAVLRYVNQMLMEEDLEEKTCTLQDSLDLQAAEKSFYEVLGKKYPPSPEINRAIVRRNGDKPCDSLSTNSSASSCLDDNGCMQNHRHCNPFRPQTTSVASISQSSYGHSNSVITCTDPFVDSPSSTLKTPDWNSENQSISQFIKGVEEASKFLPDHNDLLRNIEVNRFRYKEPDLRIRKVMIKEESKDGECSSSRQRGRKNPHREDVDIEDERSTKQPAVYADTDIEEHVIDKMLLHSIGEGKRSFLDLCESLKNATIKTEENVQSQGSIAGKGRAKKRYGKGQVVDLRTLLINCAQAVAADDRRNANELLRQVRQHSSASGDGNQRLAHCFANGLEARLAATGSQIYKGLVSKRRSAANVLKAYHLYLAACPFRKLTNFVSNKTIKELSSSSTRIHIIDFGILYGFQWPTFIQRISWRPGGPPKVRITGIEFPQPGFRPAERVEETGRRLAAYAKKFDVPFEYHGIAKKWETIKLEELKIDREDFIVVTCLYRAKNLLDETVVTDSPKDVFLRLVNKINPNIFIHGVTNGAYSAPFFVTRFREALFHFSSLFDMLDTIVPRDDMERMLIEKEIIGREALNVVACEGWERVERPETYKQWQVRSLRAGFLQLAFDRQIVQQASDKVRKLYHKDFMIDEDGRWLLQGWKGRITYALSAWRPA